MYDSVRNAFLKFSAPLEGRIAWMYLDIKGLVTIGVGNLIDPLSLAIELPFVHNTGSSAASADEIEAEWQMLKGWPGLAMRGALACAKITTLRLEDEAIDALVFKKLSIFEKSLATTFPEWESWPADAQLGLLSVAWAAGTGLAKGWPKLTTACLKQDFATAAVECQLAEAGNAGVIRRNTANKLLFRNAAAAIANGLDASRIYYPRNAAEAAPDVATDTDSSETDSTPSPDGNAAT